MKRGAASWASFLAAFLLFSFAAQAQYEMGTLREQFTVERSPFGSAEFSIYSHGKLRRDSVGVGREDGIAQWWSDEPPGKLNITFGEIMAEVNLKTDDAKVITRWGLGTRWEDVEIQVDKNVSGMLISYKRDGLWVKRVVVIVPTEKDKKIWEEKATVFYKTYRKTFFLTSESERSKAEQRERAKQERIKQLQGGPMLVFPY